MKLDTDSMWNALGSVFVGCIMFALIGLVCLAGKAFTATGKVDFCSVRHIRVGCDRDGSHCDISKYKLEGHVDWRPNQTLGVFDSFSDAVAAAKTIDCPIH